jgi:hypothetical protein
MKLRKEMIDYLAKRIVTDLVDREILEVEEDQSGVIESIANIISDDLRVEDDLNDEVKLMLEAMEDDLDRSNVDYRKMFQMVKSKIARERGLIL